MDEQTIVDLYTKNGIPGSASIKYYEPGQVILPLGHQLKHLNFLYDGVAACIPMGGSRGPRVEFEADFATDSFAALAPMYYVTRRTLPTPYVAAGDRTCIVARFESGALVRAFEDGKALPLVYAMLVRSDMSRQILLLLCTKLGIVNPYTNDGDPVEFYEQRLKGRKDLHRAAAEVLLDVLLVRTARKKLGNPDASEASLVISPDMLPTRSARR